MTQLQDSLSTEYSLYFDGKTQGSILRIPYHESQNSYLTTRALTFEAWVKPMRSNSRGEIFNKAIGDCKDDWVLAVDTNLTPHFKSANSCTGNNRIVEQRHGISVGTWHHIAGVWDGDTIRLFIDGKQVKRAFFNETPSANAIDMSIGASNHWDGRYVGFHGYIDEARYSNVARYTHDFTPTVRHLTDEHTILLFHFDEGEGNVIADSSYNRLNGYVRNIQWSEDSPSRTHNSHSILPDAEQAEKADENLKPILIVTAVLLAVIALAMMQRKRRRALTPHIQHNVAPTAEQPTEHRHPSVSILGNFRVTGSNGVDLTASFPPKAREHFLFILVHSMLPLRLAARGVHSSKLSASLWPDVDADSAKNSRNVSAARIRQLLGRIGNVRLVCEDSIWRIEMERGLSCDLVELCEALQHMGEKYTESQVSQLAQIASRGVLLDDQTFDWLDPIRVDLREEVVGVCMKHLQDSREGAQSTACLRLADAILTWDPLNERALSSKVRLLLKHGRPGHAKEVYERYAREYFDTVGKTYHRSFHQVFSHEDPMT